MELNRTALDILLKYDVLEPDKTSMADFQFAKEAGYMFDRFEQTHDEAIVCAFLERSKCNRKHITNLFLSSLSSNRVDWRVGLSAYAVMESFPKHKLESNGANCVICPSFNVDLVDYSFMNNIRFSVGGIIDGSVYELAFVLKQHNTLADIKPTMNDIDIFKSILDIIKSAQHDDGPSTIQKQLKKIERFRSNKEQRKALIETLGFCGILETDEHRGFLYKYTNLGLAPQFKHNSYWMYPVDWWKGKNGISQEALNYWFGEYEELRCMID